MAMNLHTASLWVSIGKTVPSTDSRVLPGGVDDNQVATLPAFQEVCTTVESKNTERCK